MHHQLLQRKMARPLRTPSCPLSLTTIFFFLVLHMSAGDVVDDGTCITTTTTSVLSRFDFPPGFVFGAGTSAYQVEGAAAEDGRKPSIWDTKAHDGETPDKDTGDIACDQYHKYKDDVKLMHKMGLDAYRFSISWSRLIPDGYGAINPKGLNYYNNLIDELVSCGIEAHVTLNHFDIPQALQDEYEGLLSPKFIEDFTAYADVCFKEYGDRVKFWTTFNEPNIQTVNEDSTTYLTAHNFLLSHAAAVHLYRTKYQEKQKGQIGITLLGFWFEPITDSPQDIAASKRVLDFHLGWFLDPLAYGRYPAIMRKIVGTRLPVFTENDSKQLKGSFDFIGLNHYFVLYVQDLPRTLDAHGSDYTRDISVKPPFPDGFLEGDYGGTLTTEWGLQKLLEYIKQKYKNPVAVIYENGYMTTGDDSSNPTTQNDTERIEYLQRYIRSLLPSIRNGSNVRGYFVWSFLDCFEVFGGYTNHFGLYGVDFSDKDRKRYPRQSVHWYSSFLAKAERKTKASSYL